MFNKFFIQNTSFYKLIKCNYRPQAIQSGFSPLRLINQKIPKISAPNLQRLKVQKLNIKNLDEFINEKTKNFKVLQLNNCQISKLTDETISKWQQLQTLNLSGNKITQFKCSKELNNLKHFDISNNKLISFPKIKAKNLQNIIIHQNPIQDFSLISSCDISSLKSIKLEERDLSKSQFPIIKNEILTQLSFIQCKLINIKKLQLCILPNLIILNLSQNNISELPVLKFPLLEKLYLNKNQLKDVSNLTKQREASQMINYPKNDKYKALKNKLWLSNIKLLNLSQNSIQQLPMLQFPQLQKLIIKNMKNLTNLDSFAKGIYKNLKQLVCSKNNKLTRLPRFRMQSLRIGYFNKNKLKNIDGFCQSQLPQLSKLCLQNNEISKISRLPFKNLKQIRIFNNNIAQLTCFNLEKYENLELIRANNNNLKKVQILSKMPVLNKIEMNDSNLQQIRWLCQSPDNIPNIKYLEFENNKIEQIPQNIANLKLIHELHLFGNPIKNIDSLQYLIKLQEFQKLQISLDVDNDEYKRLSEKIKKYPVLCEVKRYKISGSQVKSKEGRSDQQERNQQQSNQQEQSDQQESDQQQNSGDESNDQQESDQQENDQQESDQEYGDQQASDQQEKSNKQK